MNPRQVVLLLAIAIVLVFVVTFATMYTPQDKPARDGKHAERDAPAKKDKDTASDKSGDKKQPSRGEARLHFPLRQHPLGISEETPAEYRVATEYGRTGQFDFLFDNPHDEPIRIGISKKNCDCADVYLGLMPEKSESYLHPLASAAASWLLLGQQGVFGCLFGTAIVHQTRLDQLAAVKPERLEMQEGLTVPARANGFIRLTWDARRGPRPGASPVLLSTVLWFHGPRQPGVALEVGALFADGVYLNPTFVNLGALTDAVTETEVLCWSSTRAHFDVEAKSSGDPFVRVVGKQPLSDGELRRLNGPTGKVLWGYRLRIRAVGQVGGQRADEGVFDYLVRVTPVPAAQLVRPLEVQVRGMLRGDVEVLNSERGISLQSFRVNVGARGEVKLETNRPTVDLKLDKYPDFMKVTLSSPQMEGGRKVWTLSVLIEPDQVSGVFPRADSQRFGDTAIYLKVEGSVGRRLRVPVTGNATQ